jgi:molecular chaperone Hsp33
MSAADSLRRFIFEHHNVRGEWVQINDSFLQAKQHQDLVNPAVEAELGKALAAVVLLSATIKFKGTMIMQLQGKGDLTALVAHADNQQHIRGLVRSQETVAGDNLKQMVGESGRLVLTIESENGERYQGIVGVDADHLNQVLENYFQQSEQLATRIWLFANSERAAGLLLQELPGTGDSNKQDWDHLQILANTLTAEEMLNLDCETLLHRLFHEEQVRLYESDPVRFKCGCSNDKIATTLVALGRSELESILKDHGEIAVDCQFCGAKYRFDNVDVERILHNADFDPNKPTILH